MTRLVLSDRAAIVEVLQSAHFAPPAIDGSALHPVLELAAAMARFSGPRLHPARRAAVTAVVDDLAPDEARTIASRRTEPWLGPDRVDLTAGLGRVVPTATLLEVLGVRCELEPTVADLDRVVAVIGRGAEPSQEADEATRRLLALVAPTGRDPVATVSVLYQSFDATAARLAATLHAWCTGSAPVPAAPRTRRVAAQQATVGTNRVEAGTEVVLEIGAAGLPFGAGPHRCPGEEVACAIVDGIVDAIGRRGYRVDPASVTTDPDGRPERLQLVRDHEADQAPS